MDERLQKIVKNGSTPALCVDMRLLKKLTTCIRDPEKQRSAMAGVKHLYIFGAAKLCTNHIRLREQDLIPPGVYIDKTREWALISEPVLVRIPEHLYYCADSLEELDIRFTALEEIGVKGMQKLLSLRLTDNPRLNRIWHLDYLRYLQMLDLSRTTLSGIMVQMPMPRLTTIIADDTPLETARFLAMIPNAYRISLRNTKLASLPNLTELNKLRILELAGSPICHLWSALPNGLYHLDLSYTNIQRVPGYVRRLEKLQVLDLSGLTLKDVPSWLTKMNMDFVKSRSGHGIRIANTSIEGIDMSIFDLPKEMIALWFAEREEQRYKRYLDIQERIIEENPNLLQHYNQEARENQTIREYCLELLLDHEERWEAYQTTAYNPYIDIWDDASGHVVRLNSAEEGGMTYWVSRWLERCHAYEKEHSSPCLFEWNCGRHTPPNCFLDEEWDARQFRQDFKTGTRRYGSRKQEVKANASLAETEKEEPARPLREMKIVFLGDGEAGKSHTIARLLHDGEQADDFPGVSTPGIVIDDKTYNIDGKDIKVHFWDFGGQEILHSMHRMFLTERTLYVVVLNVREGNQDERARYWLHNLRSFAKGAPVLLVLNKMDMNKNASVNESDLRAMYPGLTEVVKMSAKEDSKEQFENGLLAALQRQIGGFKYLESPFLPAWSRLKDELQNMQTSYIRGDVFRSFCDKCGVTGSDDLRRSLLKWFSDLGVSFCYSGSRELEDYVVLRPDWITNAIYILLFNKVHEVKNGLVTHDTIYEMLQSPDTERTVPGATYDRGEMEYVLNVFRKFRLSFCVEDGVEFLPMLCDANSTPAAEEYAGDPDALEFRMEYEYLPNNVLHRLMVERRRDLDLQNVWLTGARFVHGETGLSAVVKSEGNLLRILVRAEESTYDPQRYLDLLKDDLERINEAMGLTVSKTEVVYKQGELVESFDYDQLMSFLDAGLTYMASKKTKRPVPIREILKQSDYPEDENQKMLIEDLKLACEKLQDKKLYWDASEDDRTDFLRDLLLTAGYTVLDQHRGGVSAGGERAGELDLDIRLNANACWTVMEALNLKSSSPSQLRYWEAHLDKLLDNYNPVGRAFLFHVSYVGCAKDKFSKLCADLYEHLRWYSPEGFELTPRSAREVPLAPVVEHQNRFMRLFKCVYDCGGAPMRVYHFFVRVGE